MSRKTTKKIYIAATRQNDGKTIFSLGLFAELAMKYNNVGYIKPVGQQYQEIDGNKIDKDAILFHDAFKLHDQYKYMSPIAIPSGFTTKYIMHRHNKRLVNKIKMYYENIQKGKEVVIIEGTGHAGVGSVFDLCNAQVAQNLKAKVIIVTCGGIGRPIDEVMLNKAKFDSYGVEIIGVIVNKIQPEKYAKIKKIVTKGFANQGLRVLGVLPYMHVLSTPTVEQLLEEMHGTLLNGQKKLTNIVEKIVIADLPLTETLKSIEKGTLLVASSGHVELILAAIKKHALSMAKEFSIAGIVLTGKHRPHKSIIKHIKSTDIPLIAIEQDTFTVASRLHDLLFKTRATDARKLIATCELIRDHVDVQALVDLV